MNVRILHPIAFRKEDEEEIALTKMPTTFILVGCPFQGEDKRCCS